MKLHQEIFNRITEILQKNFGSDLKITVENGGTFLEIKDSDFWIESNEIEVTIGFGTIHGHYSEDYDNLEALIDKISSFLTNEIKVTKYIKGNYIYKVICDIIYDKSKFKTFGSARIMIYPFWKETKIEVITFDRLIDKEKVLPDFEKLKNDLEETEDKILLKLILDAKEEGIVTEKEFYKALNSYGK